MEDSTHRRERWQELHGDVDITPIVHGWLRFSFFLARALTKLHISANEVTLFGGALSVLLCISPHSWWSLVALVVSLIADGVDGSVAIYQGRESRRGALLDSVIDRVAEFFWSLALIRIGIPLAWLLVLYVTATTQEYLRARLLAVGNFKTGVITLAERPHRAIYCGLLLGFSHLPLELHRVGIITALTIAWAILQSLSLVMVARDAYSQITSKDRLTH